MSASRKPTSAQRRALEAARDGRLRWTRELSGWTYYWIDGETGRARTVQPATGFICQKEGWIARPDRGKRDAQTLGLTDTGREALKAARGEAT